MMALPVILGMLVFLTVWAGTTYNRLVGFKNRMKEAWSVIDVYLKKRYDLIPNLVETVKGYATHEKQTLENITRYRSEAMQAKDRETRMQSEAGLGKALVQLLAVAENYPELKASSNFSELQRQLTDLENDLSAARRYYNGTVRENNICVESFPSNIIAGMFSFPQGRFFEIDQAEKEVPGVSFH
jgi:LemA protein